MPKRKQVYATIDHRPIPATEQEMRDLLRLLRGPALRRMRAARAVLAREDVNTFAEAVLRDANTQRPIVQAALHARWHQLLDTHDKLVLWSSVETGKTNQVVIARTLWELGRNPNLRFLFVAATDEQATKLVRGIKEAVESNPGVREVFPNLRPGAKWTEHQITVQRSAQMLDPSVKGVGVGGPVLGSRLDRVIIDDVINFKNSRTPAGRRDLNAWLESSVMTRLTPGGRVVFTGTGWHPEDAMHTYAARHGWAAHRFPLFDEVTQTSSWPERWPLERVLERRRGTPPGEWARSYLCVARSDEDARFKSEYFDTALRAGAGKRPSYTLNNAPPGVRIFTGVDVAIQAHDAADLTAFVTVMVHLDGRRELLNVESGRMSAYELVERVRQLHHRYGGTFIVENNAAQDVIVQMIERTTSIPVLPFTTGRNKAHPEHGVESLAGEFARGQWILPNVDGTMVPEMRAVIDDMLYYQPGAHTGDRLMALWFAREGIRLDDNRPTGSVGRLNLHRVR